MPVILDARYIDEWIHPMTDLIRVKEIAWNSLTEMALEKQSS